MKEAFLLQGTQPAFHNFSDLLFFSITCVKRYLCLQSINVLKSLEARVRRVRRVREGEVGEVRECLKLEKYMYIYVFFFISPKSGV